LITGHLKRDLGKLTMYNGELHKYYSLSTEKKMIKQIFGKEIKIWEISPLGIPFYSSMDTFTSNDYLVQRYLPLLNLKVYTDILKFLPELPFTFNNTVNDYLLVSESIISDTTGFLPERADEGLKALQIILICNILCITTYGSLFIVFAVILSRGYQKLCRALIKTKEEMIYSRINELENIQELFENDIDRKGFIEGAYSLFNENKLQEKEQEGKIANSNSYIRNKRYDMNTMNRYLAKLVVLAIFFFPIFLGFVIATMIESNTTFNELTSFVEQVSLLSAGTFQSSMIFNSLVYESLFINISNMFVRHQRPSAQVLETLDEFGKLNSKLVSQFLTKPGQDVDSFLENIFERDICGYFEGEQQEDCFNATNYQTFGLLQLNTQYLVTLTTFIQTLGNVTDFAKSDEIFESKKEEVIGVRATLEVVYPYIIAHVLGKLANQINTAKRNELWFCLAGCLTTIVFLIYICVKPLKYMKRVDLARRRILKVVPLQMIQENKALKFYLVQDFKKEIDSIKNIL